MKKENVARNIEIATNVAILIVALLMLGTFAGPYFFNPSKPRVMNGLRIGQTLSQLPGLSYQDSPKTLLIALSPNCSFCAASMPFYNRLAESQRNSPQLMRIVGIFPGSEEQIQQFTNQEQLSLETKPADFKSLGLTVTPTMILVDPKGRILNFWIGKLSAQDEVEVLKLTSNQQT